MNNKELEGLVDELKNFQSSVYGKLKVIKVKYDFDKDSDVVEAITQLFGAPVETSEDFGFVNFDMYLKCLEIIKKAGELKADSILSRELNDIS